MSLRVRSYPGNKSYRFGGGYFTCDRCSGTFRRTVMITEWTGLKVDRLCLDPRPPQMTPPDIFPEGIPFMDARPPQDRPDRLQDDTFLYPVVGGIRATNGQINTLGPGAESPQSIIVGEPNEPGGVVPQGPGVLADDITLITGVSGPWPLLTPIAPANLRLPKIGPAEVGQSDSCGTGEWTGTNPVTFSFQWFINGAPVLNATRTAYTPASGDLGKMLYCVVTGANALGSATAQSNTVVVTS